MDFFEYKNGELFCEGVRTAELADKFGTPVYVYSAATLLHHYRALREAFATVAPMICFSIKSLSNIHILRMLAAEGSGFDVVSGGELARARAAGADMDKIVFAGVGKTDVEIAQAIEAGIALFNVESEAEFENLSTLAASAGRKVRAALRVNPDVDPKTHRHTTTGKKETKFGVDLDRAEKFFASYGRDENVRLDALHMHIGSPVYSTRPYVDAIKRTLRLIKRLRQRGFEITALDIGGGFGADYIEGQSPLAADYAAQIVPLLKGNDLDIIIEPGRHIACNAGVLLTKVLYVKQGGERNFVVVDAAMTDLLRPALYDAEHFAYPVRLSKGAPAPRRRVDFVPPDAVKVDIVGGVCETADFLAKDHMLPPVGPGDVLAIFSAGAYGFVMSSQYNSRPRAAEVLVEGQAPRIIRRRETYHDLIEPEQNPGR